MEQTGCDDGSLQDSAPSCVLGRTCPSAWGEEECLPRAAGLASTPRAYGQEPGNSWDSDDLTEAGRAALSGPHPAPARSWPRQRSRLPSAAPMATGTVCSSQRSPGWLGDWKGLLARE